MVFFYREQSLMPFSRKYSSLFDHLEVDNAGQVYGKDYFTLVTLEKNPGKPL